MNTLDSSLRRNLGGQPPPVLTRLGTEIRSLPKGKSGTCPQEFLPQHNYIHTKVPNHLPNHHDTPAFFKPIRRIYFPPHHRSHEANPLQHRQQTFLTNSDKSSTSCNTIPVPTPLPRPHQTTQYTHLRPTAPTIPFYGSIFCVLLWYYTICVMFHLH